MSKLWIAAILFAAAAVAQPPKFEVVSIKPCKDEPPMPGRKGASGGSIGGGPDRFVAECATLRTLIRTAYITFAGGKRSAFVSPRVMQQEIKGSPSWMDSARFDIQAKASERQDPDLMRGPMLQALLEERFGLRIHRETREVPVYELRVAKGRRKFTAAKPGGCSVLDRAHPPDPEAGVPMRICGAFSGDYMYGTTMENLARQMTAAMDRDVIDRTGLEGAFDLHFEWPQEDLTPDLPPDPTRFGRRLERAVQRLGFRLDSAKGSAEFLVIDAVSRPSGN